MVELRARDGGAGAGGTGQEAHRGRRRRLLLIVLWGARDDPKRIMSSFFFASSPVLAIVCRGAFQESSLVDYGGDLREFAAIVGDFCRGVDAYLVG